MKFGRYRVIDKLAAGGMGEVYTATHELMNRDAVVKVLLPEMSADRNIVKRFFNEAQAAASIQHPGIVAVFDVGEADDGRAYIVMEKLPGESLQARLDRVRWLEPAHASALMRQLAGAVGAAHERGIVHRDLKPANVFVVPDPEVPGGERIKVLDFGLAKLIVGRGSLATHAGSIFGTPAYMAPEQCMDAASVDHRADLYAIGCMFYACVCGRPPFVAGNPLQVMMAHVNETAPPPRSLQPALPPYHESVILNLLQKRPEERMPSCAALIEALDLGAVLFAGSPGPPSASGGLAVASTAYATGSHAPAGSQAGAWPGHDVTGSQPGPARGSMPAPPAHAAAGSQAPAAHALGYAPTAPPPAAHAMPSAPPTASHAPAHPMSAAPPSAPPAASHVSAHPMSAAPPAAHAPAHAPPAVSPAVAQSSISAGAGHVQTVQPAPTAAPRRSRWPVIAGAAAVLAIAGLSAALIYVTTREPATQAVATTGDAPGPAPATVDEKDTPAAAGDDTRGTPAQAPGTAGTPGAAAPAAAGQRSALAALPGNAQVVARIDVARVMSSPLYHRLIEPMLSAQSDGSLENLLGACGEKRVGAIEAITVGRVGKSDEWAMVFEGPGRDDLAACLRGLARAGNETVDVRHDGNVTRASSGGETWWFGWLDDTTFVTRTDARKRSVVAGMLDGVGGVDGKTGTMALIGKTDQKAAIWMVAPSIVPTEPGMAYNAVYMSIDVSGGLALTLGLRHPDPQTAAAAAAALQEQLAELEGPAAVYNGATRIQTRDRDVVISMRLGMDAIEKLMQGGGGMDADILGELLPDL